MVQHDGRRSGGYLCHLVESVEELGGYDGPRLDRRDDRQAVADFLKLRDESVGHSEVDDAERLESADAILSALRPQPSGETREAVARIIDPGAWRDRDLFVSEDGYEDEMSASFVSPSFKKTDAILALLSARPLALGGQQAGEVRQTAMSILQSAVRTFDAEDRTNLDAVLDDLIDAPSTTPARAEAQDEGAAGESAIDLARRCTQTIAAQYGPDSDPANGARMVLAALICAPAAHPSPTPAADADRVRIAVEALEPFVPVWAKLTGLSDGIDVRLDASFALQDATGRARGATCNPNLPKLTVGDFRKAHKALAALKSTAAKAGGE